MTDDRLTQDDPYVPMWDKPPLRFLRNITINAVCFGFFLAAMWLAAVAGLRNVKTAEYLATLDIAILAYLLIGSGVALMAQGVYDAIAVKLEARDRRAEARSEQP